jgi:hypothetical protein
MRDSNRTPSIVPRGDDETVYLVADDFGHHGRCWRETDIDATDLETVLPTFSTANTTSAPSSSDEAG